MNLDSKKSTTQFEWKDEIWSYLLGTRIGSCHYTHITDLVITFVAGPDNTKLAILTFINSDHETLIGKSERMDMFLNKNFARQELINSRLVDIIINSNEKEDEINFTLIDTNDQSKVLQIKNPVSAIVEILYSKQ